MSLRTWFCLLACVAWLTSAGCSEKPTDPKPSPNPTTAPPSSQNRSPIQPTAEVETPPTGLPSPTNTASDPPQVATAPNPPMTNEDPFAPGVETPPPPKTNEPQPTPTEGPVEAPSFPAPGEGPKIENDPPIQQRQPRQPMEAPPEAKGLVRVTPKHDVWLDGKNKRVVLGAKVVLRQGPLELFCTIAEQKEHEAVLSVLTEAKFVHAALLSWGFEPGHPVKFRPEYVAAEGPEVEITVHWTDENGKRQSARAQDWVRDADSGKPLQYPFVFGGSGFWQEEPGGPQYYLAEGGDFICVSNFPSAMLDLPIRSSDTNNSLLYEAFTDRIPPRGTEVALVLTPKPWKKPAAKEGAANEEPVEAPPADEGTATPTAPAAKAPALGDPTTDDSVEAPASDDKS